MPTAFCYLYGPLAPFGVCPVFLNLRRRDPHGVDRIADHAGEALPAFGLKA